MTDRTLVWLAAVNGNVIAVRRTREEAVACVDLTGFVETEPSVWNRGYDTVAVWAMPLDPREP